MREHAALVARLARRSPLWRVDRAEAESRAWLAVWRASETWKAGAGASFETWAGWYAAGKLAHGLASARRHSGLPLDDAHPAPATPTPEPWLAAAVVALPPRQRLAVALVYGTGASQADAGAEMGVTGEAVRQLLAKAVARLRVGRVDTSAEAG